MNLAPGFRPPPPGGAGGVAMENLEKQLICPVCLEMFSKPVVILPCQHNLCRKCASDVFQAASPVWQTRGSSGGTAGGGRFRCPSCRHEVILDRHGVFGLQRNLLVENIIDIYRQQESSRPASAKQQQLMCEEHEDERINIYCLSCETPSCSMCKVFGRHRGCEVAPLSSVYVRQKTELSDAIALLVAANDHVQAAVSQLEETCLTIQVNSQTQRERLSVNFDELVGVLEERKQQLVGGISREQDERLKQARSLLQRHRQHLEGTAALLEEAIHTMEEPHRALLIMRAESILEKMAAMARSSNVERLELGYESLSHFVIDTDDLADILKNIDFCGGEDEDEDDEAERDEDL